MPTNAPSNAPRGVPAFRPSIAKPQWLVSVRDLTEAARAVEFGVDLLDLKEPSAGALSPVSIEVWQRVARQAARWSADPDGCPLLSAALGESAQALRLAESVPPLFTFAKAGPSGCESPLQIRGVWDAIRERLPESVELVAVAYADHLAACCLPAEEILALAARSGFRRILLDTFEKEGRSAIDLLGAERLLEFGRQAHRQRLWWSLAGSITLQHVQQIARLIPEPGFQPDCFAVRGAVCDGHRIGSLSDRKMRLWKQAFG